jgi:hypothetical protein
MYIPFGALKECLSDTLAAFVIDSFSLPLPLVSSAEDLEYLRLTVDLMPLDQVASQPRRGSHSDFLLRLVSWPASPLEELLPL